MATAIFGRMKEYFCRHTWKPLRTMYRYNSGYAKIEVKRCQCQKCGKIAHLHFNGKKIVY